MSRATRGQMILLAAAALAVALVPITAAVLQLGYHGDVRTTPVDRAHETATVQVLERAVADARKGVPAAHDWVERERARAAIRADLSGTLDVLNRSALADGTVLQVTYNRTAAERVAGEDCPSGSGRDFGTCEASDGVVLQSRDGRTHLVGVAFDVRSTGPDRSAWLTTVVGPTSDD